MIRYDEYELLELFCGFPNTIDEEAEILDYRYTDSYGFSLSLYLSAYDEEALVILEHDKFIKPIFSLDLNEVRTIKGTPDKLVLVTINKEILVYFKPNFSLSINLRDDG